MVDGCLRRSLLIGDTLAGDLGVIVARNPLGGGNGVDLLAVHCVNLLEGAVLGLDDEEEDNEDEGSTTSGVDETVEVVNGISDEASAETMLVRCSIVRHDESTYKKPMRKLKSQLVAVAIAMQRDRY